ncbi:MAG TPA: acetyl-CoA hydrolase/transferase C-terminal domain-containing protein [Thermoplasmata archaeon]|nr:acetyl-CoA hydrolase/transferase C-terminal domain-containing protein [Thermoplasmata archaeon]
MSNRVRPTSLRSRVMDAAEAVERFVPERGSIAFSCMGGSSLAKEVPDALGRAAASGRGFNLTLLTGGATTERFERAIAPVGIRRRFPYLSGPARKGVNDGRVEFFDPRIGEVPEFVRRGIFTGGKPIDVSVIEATAIGERGHVIPSLSLDALPAFVEASRHVIIEVNERKPDLTGLHDVYRVRPGVPIPIRGVRDRVGTPYVTVPPSKIAAIVITDRKEEASAAYSGTVPADRQIADAVAGFLEADLKSGDAGRFALQLGAGPLAAALLDALPFRDLDIWTEGIPARWAEAVGDRVRGISTTAMYLLPGDEGVLDEVFARIEAVRKRIVLRPYDVSNSLEVIARLNLITVQQALEVDLFGGANTSHIGSAIHNGVGGSPDFDRAARLVVVAMPSTAGGGRFSRIVPFASSPDIPRQDVDVLITDQGCADLRGKSARERAEAIIDRCSHPAFRDRLWEYYRVARAKGGHLPIDWEAAARFRDGDERR